MKYVKCPTAHQFSENDVSVFLGGGISNCPDWQKEMAQRFKDMDEEFVLIDPRRDSFDTTNPDDSEFQIEWEFFHLQSCDAAIFWFPYQTLCPITLYELGLYAGLDVPLFVGCHPAYQRKFDVTKQLSLIRPDIEVHDNWGPLVEDVKDWYASIKGEAV